MVSGKDDRVKETSTTTGVGTYSLDGAVTGFQGFVAGVGGDNTCHYCATDGIDWEVGVGTVTDAVPDTLARTSVISSSNGDAAVNWGAGIKNIFCALPASIEGTSDNTVMARIATPTYSTVQHMQNLFHSAGATSGGGITDDTDGTISVAGGTGTIRATDSIVAELLFIDFDAEESTNVDLVDNDLNYLYVEYNSGSPRVVATITKRTDFQTNIFLGTVYRDGTNLHITAEKKIQVNDYVSRMIRRLQAMEHFAHESGALISETGTRNIALTAGVFWEGVESIDSAAQDTSGVDTFAYYYRDGVGGWTIVTAQTQIDNTQYDDGTGILATLSNAKYGVHWVYEGVDGDFYVIYGQGDYLLAAAQDAGIPATLPPHLEGHGILVGKVIIKKSAATFTSIETPFDGEFVASIPTDHGALSGLSDDDHTQYFLADGTRAVSGNITVTGTVDGRDVAADGTKLDTVATSANNYSHPNHTGDVTSVADGAQTIAANAVSLAKMAQMATASLIGRNTAGTGDPEVLSAATTRAILNIENGATADQTDSEIETAYQNQVTTVSQAEAEAGVATTIRTWTALRVAQAIAALGGSGGSDFTAGDEILFHQTSASTGWTKQTTHNDKSLRVVSGVVGSGGATAFSSVFSSGKVTGGRSLSIAQLAAHPHSDTAYSGAGSALGTGDSSKGTPEGITSDSAGSGSTHDHTLSLDLQYVDLIIASKDA